MQTAHSCASFLNVHEAPSERNSYPVDCRLHLIATICLKIDQGIPVLPKAVKVLKCRPTDLPPIDNQANTCLYLHLIPHSARNVSESGWSTNQFIL